MSEARSNLIYDIGLFDGEDTAYYLFRGYNVVAVDANPLMIERAKVRFSKEILAQRPTLLNVGISSAPGTATFWISDTPEWSSFDRTFASRNGTAHRPLFVSTVPFSQLLAEHGVPHYLKIDIEGNDRFCVDALKKSKIPKYISVESECVGDSALSHEEALAMLELLRDVGYQRFKLVNQRGLTPARTGGARLFMHLLTSAAHSRLLPAGLSGIAAKFEDSERIKKLGFAFARGSTARGATISPAVG